MQKKNKTLGANPLKVFLGWFGEATRAKIKNPEAMTLATASKKGIPSARIVLFKGIDKKGIRFYTNYKSQKGNELKANPCAAVVFYWPELDKQVRIEGKVELLAPQESDAYWNTRPVESQLSSFVSPQSSTIPSREFLENKIEKLVQKLNGSPVPRPVHWGGYRLIPTRMEFWIAGHGRFHDRFCYLKRGQKWMRSRLAP